MDDFRVEVDVLNGQAERLSLPESEAGSDLDEDAIALGQTCPDSQDPVGRPRLDPAGRGCRRADRACATGVACETAVFDGGLEHARQRRPDETDRRRAEVLLQPLLPAPQRPRSDAGQRQRTEVRDDVPTDPLLDALESGRVAALGGPPVGRDVVLEGDGSVAWIDELASAGVGLGLGEPGLGILECVEGPVLDSGDALDAVAGALAVHGRALAFTGLDVGSLLEPSVFCVAGQVELLEEGGRCGALGREGVRRLGCRRPAAGVRYSVGSAPCWSGSRPAPVRGSSCRGLRIGT